MAWRQRRAARRHHVEHPSLVHRHDVGVPFDEKAALLFDDLGLGEVHAVEHLRLVVKWAFWRVEVFRDLLFCTQGAPTESDDPARHIPNREHHTPLEEIPKRTVLALFAQPNLHQLFGRIPSLLPGRGQCIPDVGAVADQVRIKDVVSETALHEIAAADGLSGGGVLHLIGEPLLGPRHHVAETLLRRCRRNFLRRALLFDDLDVVPLGQHPKGFRVADLFDFHQKRDKASALLA